MPSPLGAPDILSQRRLGAAQNEAKAALERARGELATGEQADRFKATGGDPARLTAIDRSLAMLDARTPLIGLARTRAAATQTALETAQTATGDLGVKLLADIRIGDLSSAGLHARDAATALAQVLGALNGSAGGRYLFSGAAVDAPAMAAADDVINFVVAGLNADPDVTIALQAVDDFFTPPAPPAVTTYPGPETFSADAFLGDAADAPPVELTPGQRLPYAVRADAPEIRELIRGLALAAAAERSNLAADPAAQRTVLEEAGRSLIAAGDGVTLLRSQLGGAEAALEAAQTRTAAERATLSIARNDMIGKDLYDAASEISSLEGRLQAIFAITARASELSFVNFLR